MDKQVDYGLTKKMRMEKLINLFLEDGMTIKKQTPMHLAGAAGQKATCVKLLELDVSRRKLQ